jgi:hypothetical protein
MLTQQMTRTATNWSASTLRDALRMKRERGDADCDAFKDICRSYAHGFGATVEGAARSMRQWVKTPHASPRYQAMREAFLADLEAIQAGTFFNTIAPARAA